MEPAEPPVMLEDTMVWPMIEPMESISARFHTSVPPPAPKGMMLLMERTGYSIPLD